jgi:hypothetical protein
MSSGLYATGYALEQLGLETDWDSLAVNDSEIGVVLSAVHRIYDPSDDFDTVTAWSPLHRGRINSNE